MPEKIISEKSDSFVDDTYGQSDLVNLNMNIFPHVFLIFVSSYATDFNLNKRYIKAHIVPTF